MANKRRFRLSRISLKNQLMLSFVAVTLAVLSVTSYYSYQKSHDILQRKTRDTSLAQFRQIERNIQTTMREINKYSNTFIYEEDVQTFLLSEHLSNAEFVPLQQEVTKVMARYLGNYDYLDSIYLFLENGMVIGGTPSQNQSSTVVGKDYPFYSNPLYLNVKANYRGLLYWTGGVTSKDFMRLPPATAIADNRLISALRGIVSMDSREVSAILPVNAVLAMNVKERYLNSLYGSLRSGANGSISIVDGDGIVISSTIEASIGSPYTFSDRIAEAAGSVNGIGSFSAERDGTPEQVLYYRMDELGWTLTDEVPSALYSQDTVAIQRFTAAVFALSVLLIGALSSLWMSRIMGSLQELIKGMRHVGRGNLGLTLPQPSNREIGQLTEQFNRMSTGILELMKRNEEAEQEKTRAEIEALQSQINPHFLFNTLNTVKWMAAVSGATNIMECVTNLGAMLRPIYNHPTLLWTVGEELDFVKNYANIMNFRYGEEVAFEYDVPPSLLKCRTLRFVIQPSIENALIHGKANKGVIRVSVARAGGDLVMAVHDTRGGMKRELLEGALRSMAAPDERGRGARGIGLSNVNRRIRLHFGEKYGVDIASEEGIGTRVTMIMPLLPPDETVQNS